jgi:hypothetical protein
MPFEFRCSFREECLESWLSLFLLNCLGKLAERICQIAPGEMEIIKYKGQRDGF